MRVMSEEKLQKLTDFIITYVKENDGETPGFVEMMEHMDMAKSTMLRYILELSKRGVISYRGKNTLEVSIQHKMRCAFRKVPIVGNIVCGSPEEQEQYIEGYLTLPADWIDGECFLLEAYGDSMVDIGIVKGDLILVKKATYANNGEVVVAYTEQGMTLKRIFWENGRPKLHAENRTYSEEKMDFYPKELQIQGVAIKAIKNIK